MRTHVVVLSIALGLAVAGCGSDEPEASTPPASPPSKGPTPPAPQGGGPAGNMPPPTGAAVVKPTDTHVASAVGMSLYPGASVQNASVKAVGSGNVHRVALQTSDSADQIAAYYLEKMGSPDSKSGGTWRYARGGAYSLIAMATKDDGTTDITLVNSSDD